MSDDSDNNGGFPFKIEHFDEEEVASMMIALQWVHKDLKGSIKGNKRVLKQHDKRLNKLEKEKIHKLEKGIRGLVAKDDVRKLYKQRTLEITLLVLTFLSIVVGFGIHFLG